MLRRTFQLIPGVGPWKEKDLWARGIQTWDDFPETGVVLGQKLDGAARQRLHLAREALARRDLKGLAAMVPPREHWRLYPEFARDAVYFDIETDGKQEQAPTVVALFDDAGLRVFIQGRNMDELPEADAPLEPDSSLLLVRMQIRDTDAAMPRMGTNRVDDQGVQLVRDWIESMTEARGYPAR